MPMLHRSSSRWRSAAACGPRKWAKWDELSEEDLACDDVFICMMENPVNSGNETGMGGGLEGDDLVLTQENSVPGAIGIPPTRAMTAGRRFRATANALNSMLSSDTYTVIMKVVNMSALGVADIDLRGTNGSVDIGPHIDTVNNVVALSDAGVRITKPSSMPASGTVYFCWWCEEGNAFFGWCATKPTKLSDIPSTQRKAYDGDLSAYQSLAVSRSFFDHYNGNFGGTYNAAYVVLSRLNLIDNNA